MNGSRNAVVVEPGREMTCAMQARCKAGEEDLNARP